MALTPEQVQIVRSTAPVLKEHGNQITSLFYSTVLAENPALKTIFNQANQANNHQAAALSGALYAYATHIDDLGALSPAVEKICQKHASLYIRPEHYKVVGTYLLRAMGDVLGEALTPQVLEAWTAAYWQLANIMIAREDQLMNSTEGWTDWRKFEIVNKVKESEDITSFYLAPVDRKPLPSFLPGQYISILADVPKLNYAQPRQYSLSDAPEKDYYRISVKRESGLNVDQPGATAHPGYISNVLHDTKNVGDVIDVSHPFGEFFLDTKKESEKPVVLLSAGVGLTPMVSIMNALVQNGTTDRISFIHAARTTAVRAFAEYCCKLASEHSHITYKSFVKSPSEHEVAGQDYDGEGRMSLLALDKNQDLLLNEPDALYFICGPTGFMLDTQKSLVDMGVSADRIRMEVFGTGAVVQA